MACPAAQASPGDLLVGETWLNSKHRLRTEGGGGWDLSKQAPAVA